MRGSFGPILTSFLESHSEEDGATKGQPRVTPVSYDRLLHYIYLLLAYDTSYVTCLSLQLPENV